VFVLDLRPGVIRSHASEWRLYSLLFLLSLVSSRLQTRFTCFLWRFFCILVYTVLPVFLQTSL